MLGVGEGGGGTGEGGKVISIQEIAIGDTAQRTVILWASVRALSTPPPLFMNAHNAWSVGGR